MTNQITIPRETWDAVLEALEYCKHNAGVPELVWKRAGAALAAANAVSVGEPTGHDGKGCNEVLRLAGRAYPRTCKACGLGPCKWKSAANAVQPQAQGEAITPSSQKLIALALEGMELHEHNAPEYKISAELVRINKALPGGVSHPQATEPAERKAGCTLCGFCAATGERIKAAPEAS